MAMTKSKSSKWGELYEKAHSEAVKEVESPQSIAEMELKNTTDSVDKQVEVQYHILNTRVGATDTQEKVDSQQHNLGPKDTSIENEALNPLKP
jgi:hypothetical protein